jgi:site-specific recombinase XerD
MAGKVQEPERGGFDSVTARTRLKRGSKHWRQLDLTKKVAGLSRAHLGYRRNTGKEEGCWLLRTYRDGRYRIEELGRADDVRKADGDTVLSFEQAADKARGLVGAGPAKRTTALTVREAIDGYIAFLRAHKKTADDARTRLARWVTPLLGDRPIVELTKSEIERCQNAMVSWGDDKEIERRNKDSANRVMNYFRAALNRAFRDEANGIPTDTAWRRVEPFKKVSAARQVHLDVAQSTRLINVSTGAFRRLVTAALLTGARAPHELAGLYVRDFRADLATLSINDGKTGAREIVLTQEAVEWFTGITAGRDPDELLLPREDGTGWTKSVHARDMRSAVAKAHLPKGTSLYSCRHTYASQSLLAGMNILLLAKNLGTSVKMIEAHYGKFLAASKRKLVEESAFKLGLTPDKKIAVLAAKGR